MASQKRRCWAREGRGWTGTGTEQDPSILAGAGAPSSWLRSFLLLDMTIIGPLSSGPLWQLPLQLKVSPLLLRGKHGAEWPPPAATSLPTAVRSQLCCPSTSVAPQHPSICKVPPALIPHTSKSTCPGTSQTPVPPKSPHVPDTKVLLA